MYSEPPKVYPKFGNFTSKRGFIAMQPIILNQKLNTQFKNDHKSIKRSDSSGLLGLEAYHTQTLNNSNISNWHSYQKRPYTTSEHGYLK